MLVPPGLHYSRGRVEVRPRRSRFNTNIDTHINNNSNINNNNVSRGGRGHHRIGAADLRQGPSRVVRLIAHQSRLLLILIPARAVPLVLVLVGRGTTLAARHFARRGISSKMPL